MLKKNNEYKTNISKFEYFLPTILMIIYILVAMIIVVVVKFSMSGEDVAVSISRNSGEEAFFNGKYDMAVSEYNLLQETEEWPIWNLKISEIYSVKGDYKKSNELIQKVYEARNRIIDTKNVNLEEFEEKDRELANGIVFNSFMNGEHKKALEYGEFFLKSYPDDIKLLKTMFSVYIANKDMDKAENIIDIFAEKETNYDDLVTAAKMNILIGRYEIGLKQLENAYKLDENNISVFDAIEDAARYNKNNVVSEIERIIDKNEKNNVYKLFLAKVYSIDSHDMSKCEEIVNELKESYSENINYLLIKMKIYVEQDENKKAENVLEEISELNEENFISEYTESLKFYYEGKYDEALKAAKRSISLNKDYSKLYSSLIPSILLGQNKPAEEEPYLRTALSMEPFNFSCMITIAEYYTNVMQDSSKGLYYYTLASEVNPKNSDVYYKMALIKYRNQRVEEAISLLKKSISLNSKDAKYYRTLGSIYLEENKNEDGITQIRKAYEIDKEDIATLNNAAYYYIYVDHNISRAMSNMKAAFKGLNETTSSSVRDIITDNYNRIKALYDSSKDSDSSNRKEVISELKLIY